MGNPHLDRFGEIIMRGIRDGAIKHWDMILDGRMKDEFSQNIRNNVNNYSNSELLYHIVPHIVDTTIHFLLCTIEDEDTIDVIQTINNNDKGNVKKISDGLAGELYTSDGWIERYSQQRKSE